MVDGHALHLTHLQKPFWPDQGLTKEDLLRYYDQVAVYLLPHLKGRPQSLHRQPQGAHDKGFFQKDVGPDVPAWVHTCALEAPSVHRMVNYLVCDDRATLLYMANLGCIELHPWLSRLPHLDRPDHLVIDLDPSPENTFDEVVAVALAVKDVLDRIGAVGLCKTSGASGMHVHVPLGARYPACMEQVERHI